MSLSGKQYNHTVKLQTVIIFLVLYGRMNGDLSGNDYVFVMLLALAAIGIILIGIIKNKTLEFLKWQCVFYAFILCSIFWSVDRETTIRYMIATFARCFLIVYISLYIRSKEDLVLVSKVFIHACFINQVYLLIVKGFIFVITLREITANDGSWNSNSLASMAAISLFLIYFLSQMIPNQSKNEKILSRIYILLDLLMCVLCGSKSGILFVVLLLAGYFIFIHRRNRFLLFILALISIPVLAYAIIKVPFLYEIIGKRIENYILGNIGLQTLNVSDMTRQNLIRLGIGWFKESPWIGKGMSTFSYLYVQQGGYRALYAHNNYIEIMVGTGIIGLIIYYFEYLRILWKARKIKDINLKGFVLVLVLSFVILDYSSVSYMVESKLFILSVVIFISNNYTNITFKSVEET